MSYKAPFLRSGFNYDRDAASDESGLCCEDPSLAKQSQLEESDINTIVRRFGLTGQVPVGVRAPTYMDFTGVYDFHSAMNAITQANEAFEQMPAEVRARFGNDAYSFVEFCSDEANRDEALKLGLVLPSEAAFSAFQGPKDEPVAPGRRLWGVRHPPDEPVKGS